MDAGKETLRDGADCGEKKQKFIPFFLKASKAQKQSKEAETAKNIAERRTAAEEGRAAETTENPAGTLPSPKPRPEGGGKRPAYARPLRSGGMHTLTSGVRKRPSNKLVVRRPSAKPSRTRSTSESKKLKKYIAAPESYAGAAAEAFAGLGLDERKKLFRDLDRLCVQEDGGGPGAEIKDSYAVFRDEALKYKLLDGEEERALAKKIEAGDAAAAELLVKSNLRLVIACAKQVYSHNRKATILDFMDLIQEGVVGLITAVNKFDWRRNTRFSTCAVPWIYQHIARSADSQRGGFAVPGYAGFSIRSMNDDIRRYIDGTLDMNAETPARLKRIKELATVIAPVVAIDQSEDPDETPGVITPDALVSDSAAGADEIVDGIQEENYKETLHSILLSTLDEEEYDVLCRRYGMGPYEEFGAAPLRVVAEELGRSIEFARGMIFEIEEKLRASAEADRLAVSWLTEPDAEEDGAAAEEKTAC